MDLALCIFSVQRAICLYKEKTEANSLGFFSYKTGGTKDGSGQIDYSEAFFEYLVR